MADAPLISLTQLKSVSGEFSGNPSAPSPQDPKYTMAINAASALVRSYTGLRFEISDNPIATERTFEYDGSGYLDIDECQEITAITTQSGYSGSQVFPLTPDEWSAQPINLPVKLWVRLTSGYGLRGISPEMGFTYNLDTLGHRIPSKPIIVKVTAVWGWPEIPSDVQQAVLWTALSISDTAKPYNQESIADYSRTRGGDVGMEAIPDRAQVALLPYIIPRV